MKDLSELFRLIAKKDDERSATPVSWILVGLGNPGDKYFHTRHNAGFLALDYIAQKCGAKIDRAKFHALCGEGTIGGARVLLMKPQTMMNASGEAVGEAASFYKIPPERVLVVSDDVTQSVGRLRVRKKGSAGGHNGLKDIISHLSSEEFPRVRIGIGEKPNPEYDLAAWVLSNFTVPEQDILFDAFGCVWEGVEKILSGDFDAAVQLCNSYRPQEKGNE